MKENNIENKELINLSLKVMRNILDNYEEDLFFISYLYESLNNKYFPYYKLDKKYKKEIYNIIKKYLFDLLVIGNKTNKIYYEDLIYNILERYSLNTNYILEKKSYKKLILNPNINFSKLYQFGIWIDKIKDKKTKFYTYYIFNLSLIMNFKSKIIKKENKSFTKKNLLELEFCDYIKETLIKENIFKKNTFENLNNTEYEKFIQNIIFTLNKMLSYTAKYISEDENSFFQKRYSFELKEENNMISIISCLSNTKIKIDSISMEKTLNKDIFMLNSKNIKNNKSLGLENIKSFNIIFYNVFKSMRKNKIIY